MKRIHIALITCLSFLWSCENPELSTSADKKNKNFITISKLKEIYGEDGACLIPKLWKDKQYSVYKQSHDMAHVSSFFFPKAHIHFSIVEVKDSIFLIPMIDFVRTSTVLRREGYYLIDSCIINKYDTLNSEEIYAVNSVTNYYINFLNSKYIYSQSARSKHEIALQSMAFISDIYTEEYLGYTQQSRFHAIVKSKEDFVLKYQDRNDECRCDSISINTFYDIAFRNKGSDFCFFTDVGTECFHFNIEVQDSNYRINIEKSIISHKCIPLEFNNEDINYYSQYGCIDGNG